MVPGHEALMGIHLLWPQSLHRECAHANGCGPNPSPNPHVTHVRDFLLHPRGRFQGRNQLNLGAGGTGGCKSLPEEVAGGSSSSSPTSGSSGSTNIRSGTVSGSTALGGVRSFSGTKGKKSSSPPRQLHIGSTFHSSAIHCHAFAGPRATCWTCGSHGLSDMKTTLVSAAPRNVSMKSRSKGQARIPERRFQNITEYSCNIPEHSGKFRQILRNIPEPCTHNSGCCDWLGKGVPI